GSIGMPLSIMEARACGIPVITTDFGSLKTFLDTDFDNIYYDAPENFIKHIRQIEKDNHINRLDTCVHKLNEKFIEIIHHTINT
ncbi:MAG: glycosyltransferase, partial [Bacteroidales bacterium]|nr:glycosyltransferase [Bacteroidales bacterium]